MDALKLLQAFGFTDEDLSVEVEEGKEPDYNALTKKLLPKIRDNVIAKDKDLLQPFADRFTGETTRKIAKQVREKFGVKLEGDDSDNVERLLDAAKEAASKSPKGAEAIQRERDEAIAERDAAKAALETARNESTQKIKEFTHSQIKANAVRGTLIGLGKHLIGKPDVAMPYVMSEIERRALLQPDETTGSVKLMRKEAPEFPLRVNNRDVTLDEIVTQIVKDGDLYNEGKEQPNRDSRVPANDKGTNGSPNGGGKVTYTGEGMRVAVEHANKLASEAKVD